MPWESGLDGLARPHRSRGRIAATTPSARARHQVHLERASVAPRGLSDFGSTVQKSCEPVEDAVRDLGVSHFASSHLHDDAYTVAAVQQPAHGAGLHVEVMVADPCTHTNFALR